MGRPNLYPVGHPDHILFPSLCEFLETQEHLANLSLLRCEISQSALQTCLQRSGKSLTRLHLNLGITSTTADGEPVYASMNDIGMIRDSCPNLINLLVVIPVGCLDIVSLLPLLYPADLGFSRAYSPPSVLPMLQFAAKLFLASITQSVPQAPKSDGPKLPENP